MKQIVLSLFFILAFSAILCSPVAQAKAPAHAAAVQQTELLRADSVQKATIARLERTNKELQSKLERSRSQIQENSQETAMVMVICTGFFICCALIVFFWSFNAYRSKKAKYEAIGKVLCMQSQLTPEQYQLLLSDGKERGWKGHMGKGITLTSIGVGIVALACFGGFKKVYAGIGLLIMCIGIGEMVIGYLQRRAEARCAQPSSLPKDTETPTEEAQPEEPVQ